MHTTRIPNWPGAIATTALSLATCLETTAAAQLTFHQLFSEPRLDDRAAMVEFLEMGWPAAEEGLTIPVQTAALQVQDPFSRQPMAFERNDGQADAQVQFLARGPGYQLFFTETEAVMVLLEPEARRELQTWRTRGAAQPFEGGDGPALPWRALRMRWTGGNPQSSISGEKMLRGEVNYFVGNDPSLWRTKIPTFAQVRYREVYSGIDLVFHDSEGGLEYDFVIHPGADPNQIQLEFEGVEEIILSATDDLELLTGGQPVRWRKPFVYQELSGQRLAVAGRYVARSTDGRHIGFEVAAYDRSRTLVIDPTLDWGTYLGAPDEGSGVRSMGMDRQGNSYVAGVTWSARFPTKNAWQP